MGVPQIAGIRGSQEGLDVTLEKNLLRQHQVIDRHGLTSSDEAEGSHRLTAFQELHVVVGPLRDEVGPSILGGDLESFRGTKLPTLLACEMPMKKGPGLDVGEALRFPPLLGPSAEALVSETLHPFASCRQFVLKLCERDLPVLLSARARTEEADLPSEGIVRPQKGRAPMVLTKQPDPSSQVMPTGNPHGDQQSIVDVRHALYLHRRATYLRLKGIHPLNNPCS